VLQTSNPPGGTRPTAAAANPVAAQLATALRERGLFVETDVGQSTFRLPLAVRRGAGDAHTLGILIDDAAHFAQSDLLERFLLRPGVLLAFGWRVAQVFTKDWHHDPARVLRQIEDALEGLAPEPVEIGEVTDEKGAAPVAIEAPALGDKKRDGNEVVVPASVPSRMAVTVPPVARDTSRAPSVPRRFICTEEGSSKFWEVVVNGSELTVRFGRIGTKGQSQAKVFTTPEAALREQEKLIRSKVGKGYTEVKAE
jgi:predicted DNA-binding WGR domain protein